MTDNTLHEAIALGIDAGLRDMGADLTGCTPSMLTGWVIKNLREAIPNRAAGTATRVWRDPSDPTRIAVQYPNEPGFAYVPYIGVDGEFCYGIADPEGKDSGEWAELQEFTRPALPPVSSPEGGDTPTPTSQLADFMQPFVPSPSELPVAPNLGAGDSKVWTLEELSMTAEDRVRQVLESFGIDDSTAVPGGFGTMIRAVVRAVPDRDPGSVGGDSTAGRWYNESRWFDDYRAAESGTVAEVTDRLVAASSEWDENTGDAETARPYLEHLAQAVESWLTELFGKWRAPAAEVEIRTSDSPADGDLT